MKRTAFYSTAEGDIFEIFSDGGHAKLSHRNGTEMTDIEEGETPDIVEEFINLIYGDIGPGMVEETAPVQNAAPQEEKCADGRPLSECTFPDCEAGEAEKMEHEGGPVSGEVPPHEHNEAESVSADKDTIMPDNGAPAVVDKTPGGPTSPKAAEASDLTVHDVNQQHANEYVAAREHEAYVTSSSIAASKERDDEVKRRRFGRKNRG